MAKQNANGQWEYDPNDPFAGVDPSQIPNDFPGIPNDFPASAANATIVPDSDPIAAANQPSAAGVGAPGNATNAIAGDYTKWLGRAPEAGVTDTWMTNARAQGLSLSDIENRIANSDEAKAYAAKNAAPAAGAAGATTSATGNATADALIKSLTDRLSGLSAAVPSAGAIDPELRASIMASIQQMIGESGKPIDVQNNPAMNAYRVESQRQAENDRSQALERRANTGMLFSGAANTDINNVNQQKSERSSAYAAKLTETLLQDRQQRLTTALSTGAGILSADQEAAYRAELTRVNSELAKLSIQSQMAQALMNNQFSYDDLGFRIGAKEADLNAGAGASL